MRGPRFLAPIGRRARAWALLLAVPWALPAPVVAQRTLTLEEAITSALSRGPTVLMARADSSASAAVLSSARSFPNPIATAQYTRSAPRHHFEVEQPIPLPWTRSSRVSAAVAGRDAAAARLALERASVRHDVEVAYVRASAAERRRELSAGTAVDALRLVDLVRERVEAGDAAELELALARVAAGETSSRAASDSVDAVTTLLELQRLIGEPVDRVTVRLGEPLESLRLLDGDAAGSSTLAAPSPPGASDRTGTSLAVSAVRADVRAAEAGLASARRSRLPGPSVLAGFESHDPSGGEPGTLPLVGIVVSLPLFDRGGAAVRQAHAELERARGALDLAERESAAAITQTALLRAAAGAQVERSRALLDDADRVATLSNRAYEEGAFPLATVLEAQRGARDARLRYVEDLAATRLAEADYELATRTRRDR